MSARGNLADPAYEPSDEDLARLMHDAFDHVGAEREESLRAMRARIERLRAEARARFEAARRSTAGP
jgi:GAF domain-containing protein